MPLGLLLAGCSQVGEPYAGDGPTIISLNPCTDAILAEVAAPGQLLAISHYSHDPAATSLPMDVALGFPVTGGTVEEVLALDPDLVVAGSFLAPATRNALERLGIRVETFGPPLNVAESAAQVRQIGALAGREAEGEALARRITAAWDVAGYEGTPVDTLLWQQGGIVPGPDSLIAQLMERRGLALHSAARGLGQGAYLPLEEVLADPPQLVLAASDERMLEHPVIQQLAGVSYDEIDPALLYCGGPTIIAALERLQGLKERQ